MNITTFDAFNRITTLQINRITNFLEAHLDNSNDSKKAIRKALQYAAKERAGLGGLIFVLEEEDTIVGAAVINKTGMEDYIPENILVYLATHKDYRNKGLDNMLMRYVINNCNGDIALHVSEDNPAVDFYKNLGFTIPYLEMRLNK